MFVLFAECHYNQSPADELMPQDFY